MAQRGFNIGVFKAELNNKNILKPNLFHVEFVIPPGLAGLGNYTDTVRTLEYWCEATPLPGMQLNTYQAQHWGYGAAEQRPFMPVFGEVQLSIIYDAENANYNFFYDWLSMTLNFNCIDGPNVASGKNGMMPYELSYRDDFVADFSVMVYDQTGLLKNKVTMREAYPKAIGDISLAWSDNNSYMRLPITFVYTDWFKGEIEGK